MTNEQRDEILKKCKEFSQESNVYLLNVVILQLLDINQKLSGELHEITSEYFDMIPVTVKETFAFEAEKIKELLK